MTERKKCDGFRYDDRKKDLWLLVQYDLTETLERIPLIIRLALLDIIERYRGSVLGPFWLTLSTLVLIITLGLVYSRLLGMEIAGYLPWLAVSLVLWNLINATIQESCHAFVAQEGMIRAMVLPFSMHVARVVMRNLLVFAHNLPILVLVLVFFHGLPGWEIFWFLPALLLVSLLLGMVGLGLGIVCTRFRDIPQVIGSMMQILFFVTPIIWLPGLLGDAAVWLWFNPMHPVLELLRSPLLGRAPAITVWVATLGWTAMASFLALVLFARYRARIPFWL